MYISGTVFLIDDNKSIYDATVTVMATGQFVKTNQNGAFSIDVPDLNSIISFDFAGITLPKELPARDVIGQTVWLQLDPVTPGAQIQVKKDYKPVYVAIGIAAILGITALIVASVQSSGNPPKPVKKEPKTVEA